MTESNAQGKIMNDITITVGGFAKFLGTVGGVLTTFIVVQPWTLYYIGTAKVALVLILIAIAIFFIALLAARKRGPSRFAALFAHTTTEMLSLLMATTVATAALLLIWSQPTRQQVAQQILNDRGMFLQRQYYKTALEVGNANGVALFGEAGFGSTLAFELLGQPAETVPDRRSVDVVLDLDDTTLRELLAVIATERPAGTDYALIDSAIAYTNTPDLQGESREPSEAPGALLFSTGLSLLGHAILQTDPETVELLLTLGADGRFATLPLLVHDALPERFYRVAIDPFLFLNPESMRDNAVIRVPGFAPSTFATPSQAGQFTASSCDAVRPSPAPKRFLGYLRAADAADALVELVIERSIGCTRYATHTEGYLRRIADDQKEVALLTMPTAAARAEAVDVAGVTVGTASQDLKGLRHFVGRRLVGGDGFVVSGTLNDDWLALAESTRQPNSVQRILAQTDSSELDCGSGNPVTLAEVPAVLECTRWTVATWNEMAVPHLIVVADRLSIRPRMMKLSMEATEVILEPGTNVVSALPFEAAENGPGLEVTLAGALPRLSRSDAKYTADWPTEAFAIESEIAAEAEQFVYLRVMETTKVALVLSHLESDVDLFVEHDADDDISAESINGEAEEENIVTVLPSGRYEVRLKAFGERSPYELRLVSSGVPSRLIEVGGPVMEHQGDVADRANDFVQVELGQLAKVSFVVTDAVRDVDIVILDGRGQRLNGEYQSVQSGIEERLDVMLPGGRYIAQLSTLEGATPYKFTVSASEPAVQSLELGRPVTVRTEQETMFSFAIEEETEVAISVQPIEGDVDMELLGRDLMVFERSTGFGEAREDIRRALDGGRYYIRVFPDGVSGPRKYVLVVTEASP